MSENEAGLEPVRRCVQVRAADAAVCDLHEHFAGGGHRQRALLDVEFVSVEGGDFHDGIIPVTITPGAADDTGQHRTSETVRPVLTGGRGNPRDVVLVAESRRPDGASNSRSWSSWGSGTVGSLRTTSSRAQPSSA